MVPVITAIVAALLAGAVALYRERRLELQQFLVATRVMRGVFTTAETLLGVFLKENANYGWDVVNALTPVLNFRDAWEQHRDVLAGQLTRPQWDAIARAATNYSIAFADADSRERTVAESRETFTQARDDLAAAAAVLNPYCDRAGWFHNPGREQNAERAPAVKTSAGPGPAA
jgi:hypothetical protein